MIIECLAIDLKGAEGQYGTGYPAYSLQVHRKYLGSKEIDMGGFQKMPWHDEVA